MGDIVFNEPLVLKFDKPMTDREVLSAMTDYLCEKGIIRDAYKQAILEWEQPFPIGPKIGGINAAILRVDICHVNRAATCIAVLKIPASFRATDESDNDIPVSPITVLTLTKAHGHVETLQRIVKLIQNQEDIKHIVEAGQPDIVHEIIKQYLLEDGD